MVLLAAALQDADLRDGVRAAKGFLCNNPVCWLVRVLRMAS